MRAAKRDALEPAVIGAMRAAGWLVAQAVAPLPFDLVCAMKSLCLDCGDEWEYALLEVKSKRGRLTNSQTKALAEGWPIHVIRSLDDLKRFTE